MTTQLEFFHDNEDREGLGRQAAKSGVLALMARVVTAFVQLASSVVIARLLAPEDFGLVALVSALTGFVPMLIDLGLTDSTVQTKRITPAQISGVFWISMGIAGVVAVLLVSGSTLLASMYHQPAIKGIASLWALTFILHGLSLQHMALLRRVLRYKEIAIIEIVGAVAGAVTTVTMALLGFGYWSLVMRPIATGVATTIGSWSYCGWRPSRPRPQRDVQPLLKSGGHISSGALVWIGASSSDRVFMGFKYTPAVIGLYQNSLMLYDNLLSGISIPLHKVGVSALSKLQGHAALYVRKFEEALSLVSFFSMPAFALLVVVAPDLVPLVLGSKWTASGVILRILAFRGLFQVLENSQTWLHMSLGQPQRWIPWTTFTAIVHVVAVVVGLRFGIEGLAWSIVIARSALALPSVIYAGRPINLRVGTVVNAIGRQLCSALVTIAVGLLVSSQLTQTGPVFRIAVATGACALCYLALMVGLFRVSRPIYYVFSLVKGFASTQPLRPGTRVTGGV